MPVFGETAASSSTSQSTCTKGLLSFGGYSTIKGTNQTRQEILMQSDPANQVNVWVVAGMDERWSHK
jgi:hypothetical protein